MNEILDPDEFNKRYPVGTLVVFHPRIGSNEGAIVRKTTSPAWALGHGTGVVKIEGKAGGVSLAHLEIAEDEVLGIRVDEVVREDQPPTLMADFFEPLEFFPAGNYLEAFAVVDSSAGPRMKCALNQEAGNEVYFVFDGGGVYKLDLARLLPLLYNRLAADLAPVKGKQ
jgi:hypothetical protein